MKILPPESSSQDSKTLPHLQKVAYNQLSMIMRAMVALVPDIFVLVDDPTMVLGIR